MPIDSNIYFQNKGIDFGRVLDSYDKGIDQKVKMSDLAKKQKQEQQEQDKRNAYQAGFKKDANGNMVFDQNVAMSKLAEGGFGDSAYALQNEIEQRNQAKAQQDFNNQFKERELKERMLDRQMQRQEQRSIFGLRQDEVKEQRDQRQYEKDALLATPYGMANTADDAKQLKEASETKKNFDNKLEQLIGLREKNNGGVLFDRESVARGKQLSKDLLLEYKNMAKLGVLSKSDEDIINAIIPEDPLEFNSPLAAIQGQDPTLSRMKEFKKDSDIDFQNRILTRTRDGIGRAAQGVTRSSAQSPKIEAPDANTRIINGVLHRKVQGGWLPASN